MTMRQVGGFTGRTIRLTRRPASLEIGACDVTGQHVAVIGAGADTAPLVPQLVGQAASVKVFQHTPAWVLPRLRGGGVLRLAPVPRSAVERLARTHLRIQVHDAWLRRQLTPGAPPRRGSIVVSNDYYPALQRENCKLITWPIARLTPDGIRTADGIEHHVDCIVFAGRYA